MEHTCIQCNGEMVKTNSVKTIKSFKGHRFTCKVCGWQEMLFGSGYRDLETEPNKAAKIALEATLILS